MLIIYDMPGIYIYRKIEYGHDELYLLAAALALNVITVTRFVIIEHLCEK